MTKKIIFECEKNFKSDSLSITSGHGLWTCSLKSRTFGLGQSNWADKFWGIWDIFGPAELSAPILVQCSESLVHVFHYSTIISTKKQAFISTSQIFIWDWHLNLGRKELGI